MAGGMHLRWSSPEADDSVAVAWADWNDDGDLELVTANWGQPNRVYENGTLAGPFCLEETPAYPVLAARPGSTDAAGPFSSEERLDSPVEIRYELFDDESDRAWSIVPEYSLDGGGQWLAAIEDPVPGSEGTADLAASPGGTPHTFMWDANSPANDPPESNNVVFRIGVRWQAPDRTGAPIQRGAIHATSPPFRLLPVFFRNDDGDGHGGGSDFVRAPSPPPGYVDESGDCDDADGDTYPGAPQLCDGTNNDCDDPDWPTVPADELDTDADSFRICSGDCAEGDATVHPGATQVCDDGKNNDCLDAAWPTVFDEIDDDLDTLTECEGDCDDLDASTYIDAPEVNDGLDNQCPGDAGYGIVDELSGLVGFSDPGNKSLISWEAQADADWYEIAASSHVDFSTDCYFAYTQALAELVPGPEPGPGELKVYLVRPSAPQLGSWGVDSSGAERVLVCSP
jgi:hypothetical protein